MDTGRDADGGDRDIEWDNGGPTPEEYMALREAAGLSPRTLEAARRGVAGSLYAVCARVDGEAIAMGRVIGDGGSFFDIVDMAVRPEYQGRGLGTRIMERLMTYLGGVAPPSSVITLLADVPADRLYARFGFEPTAPATIGMIRRVRSS